MNKSKLIAILSASSILSTPLIAVSCSSRPNEVIFRLPQGENWPLASAVKPFVEYYNKTQKDNPDFIKVKAVFSQKDGIFSEFELIKSIKESIESGRLNTVPNLILGAQSGAYVINQDRRLLDVSDTGVNKKYFIKEIANLHSQLSGQADDDKLYNLPFDNIDVNALQINLDLMYKMFELIKEGGGQVDESSKIYEKALEASKTGSNIPDKSIWLALKAKKDGFKNLQKVDDETFSSLEGVRHFSKAFAEGVELDYDKVNKDTLPGEVYAIDYQEDTFLQELQARTNKATFELKTNKDNPNQPTSIQYNIVSDPDVQKSFKELWDDYNDSVITYSNDIDAKTSKHFQSVKYMSNKGSEWGSYRILKYHSAISYAPSLGANSIFQTPRSHYLFTSKDSFGTHTEEEFKKYTAQKDDVSINPQIILNKKGGNKVFQEGGSSIIPVDVKDERFNKATKAFIKWLYTGENDIIQDIREAGLKEPNWKTFAKLSGYIMPISEITKEENIKWVDEEYAKYEKRISEEESKGDQKDDKKIYDESSYKNHLVSYKISLESILKLKQNDVKPLSLVKDDVTAEITKAILSGMFNSSKYDSPSKTSADKMIESFTNLVNANK
ncbi:glycerol ABC transporter substrate-binding protein [Mycoplasmopsis mucosicanis]|uniref:Glycerol ABC transporter substrate-binding protein n=1 Tax=Mycoplasmopsis mucosicanis TaxID=458208 RepID=A0A507SK48_9BACT|nr:glycerol ABC transporter substrate-binding protein [Mycoplasmopsis mucosicanis]TQC51306.1 glycerol ABC transporter substrate-binding protein [Mycoplasmopsis mucosicanis]